MRWSRPVRALAMIGLLSLTAFTGCMTTPHLHQVIGKTGDKFDAAGYLLDKNTFVTFQYYHFGVNQWQVIGITKSGNLAIPWDGQNWYGWSTKNMKIPPGGWAPGGPGGTWWARVRAVSAANGKPLATFRSSFDQAWDVNKPLDQLWSEIGYGTEVRILANP